MLEIMITDREATEVAEGGAATMAEAMELVNSYYGCPSCECWFVCDEAGNILAEGAY